MIGISGFTDFLEMVHQLVELQGQSVRIFGRKCPKETKETDFSFLDISDHINLQLEDKSI